jgi:hypothetical protein
MLTLECVCVYIYVCACEGGGGRRASAGKQEWCTAEEVESAIEESQMEGGSEEELDYPVAEKGGKEESDTQQEFLGDKLQYPQTFWGESEEEEETSSSSSMPGMRDAEKEAMREAREKMRAPKGQDERRSGGKRKRSGKEKDGDSTPGGSAGQEGAAKLFGAAKKLLHNAKLKLKKKKERLAGAREEEGAGPSETSRGIAGGKAKERQEKEKSSKKKTRDATETQTKTHTHTHTHTDTDTETGNEKKEKSSKKKTRDTTYTTHTHTDTGTEKKAHDTDTDTEKKEKSSMKKTHESQDSEENVEAVGGAGGDEVEKDSEEEEVGPWRGVYVGERSGTGEFSPRPTKREDQSAGLGGSERVAVADEVRRVGVYECAYVRACA